jgi:enoyl-[acyl-carrier protein] reductase I
MMGAASGAIAAGRIWPSRSCAKAAPFHMTYYGSQMVVKNTTSWGVATAALKSAVRYIAAELGPKGSRVHAISPGPLATRAASGIPEFDVCIDDVGVATAFFAHDAARLITGETLYVDGDYHIID